jgi:hypothetical protein
MLHGSTGVTIIGKFQIQSKAFRPAASSRQSYSKRRTDKLKTPDTQTVALDPPAELS